MTSTTDKQYRMNLDKFDRKIWQTLRQAEQSKTRKCGAISRALQSTSFDDLNLHNYSWRGKVRSAMVSTTRTIEGLDLHRTSGAVSRHARSSTGNAQGNIINNNNPYASYDEKVTKAGLSGSSATTNAQSSNLGSVSRAAASGTTGTSYQKKDNKNKKKRNQWKR
jgi:hypothetical protein